MRATAAAPGRRRCSQLSRRVSAASSRPRSTDAARKAPVRIDSKQLQSHIGLRAVWQRCRDQNTDNGFLGAGNDRVARDSQAIAVRARLAFPPRLLQLIAVMRDERFGPERRL